MLAPSLGAAIGVLTRDAVVHFVHADRVEDRHGAADRVVEGAVEGEDLTVAVAAA
jgi:hypothetical protein